MLMDTLLDLAATPRDALPPRAVVMARLSLQDWMACGMAGKDEPLAVKLRELARIEGGTPTASIIGGTPAPARMAALVNGATSHALDYDDTHFAHVGHLSVAIYPAALAVAEEMDASTQDTIAAFLVGAEGAIRVGLALGRDHYDLGFHQTATSGAFGATLAAGRLYGLTRDQMRTALSLCATRASGLKSQFGTMGKPYNAGIGAANGVECATLARLGFTSADDALSGPQGFIATHSPAPSVAPPLGRFLFEDNKYKLHACCHGTHAMIEALLPHAPLLPEQVFNLTLNTNSRWLQVCDLKAPRTGLEVKFSYAWLAGMTLRGDATGDDRIYTDALAADTALSEFAKRVEVIGEEHLTDQQVTGTLYLRDGSEIALHHDLADPMDIKILAHRLRAKADAMLGETGAALWTLFDEMNMPPARTLGSLLSNRVDSADR